eukprot:32379-Prymnesium_polylepis.1
MRLVESKRGAACGSQRSATEAAVSWLLVQVQLYYIACRAAATRLRMPRTTVRTPLGRCGLWAHPHMISH